MIKSYNYLENIPLALLQSEGNVENSPIMVPDEVNLVGARKSGKTMSIVECVVKTCIVADKIEKKVVVPSFRKMNQDVEMSIFAEYTQCLKRLGLVEGVDYRVRRKDLTIIFKHGSEIRCRGLHTQNDASVKITGLAGLSQYSLVILWFEEAFEINEKDKQDVKEAIRGCNKVVELNSCNPWLASNEYIQYCLGYQSFNEKVLKEKGEQLICLREKEKVKIFHYTNYLINYYLSKWDISQLQQVETLDPKRARVAVWGLPGSEEGMVFSYLMDKVHNINWKDQMFKYTGGIDYGEKISATTASLWATDYDHWRIGKLRECFWSNSSGKFKKKDSEQLANFVVDNILDWGNEFPVLKREGIEFFVDNHALFFISMLERRARKLGMSGWVKFSPCFKIGEYLRVDFMRGVMSEGRMYMDVSCTEGRREYNNLAWDPRRTDSDGNPKILDKDNHTFDADIYALMPWLDRIRRATKNSMVLSYHRR